MRLPKGGRQRNEGNYFWFRLIMMIFICFTFVWLWGWKWMVPGIFSAFVFALASDVFREIYCSVTVFPGGVHEYNAATKYLGKHMSNGPAHHRQAHSFLPTMWASFLYSVNSDSWSWRPYALLVILAIILYLSPPLFYYLVAMFLFIVFVTMMHAISTPTSLFLGSSNKASHRMLTKMGRISGFKWAALLRDEIPLSEHPSKADMQMTILDIWLNKNVWSLRVNDDNWRDVVFDYINASAVIVLWPDINNAVQEEIDYLEQVDFLEKVIVIRTEDQIEEKLPYTLHKCLMNEKDAIELVSLTASDPGLFKQQLYGRMKEYKLKCSSSDLI